MPRSLTPDWPCLHRARAHDPATRCPVRWGEGPAAPLLGSVAWADVPALAAWPELLSCGPEAVRVHASVGEALDTELASVHRALQAQGRIRAWRDEPYPWLDERGQRVAVIERAASRFWGALTFGAHCNGLVMGADGRPSHLWIAQRSPHKPTDPGMLDNLIGGGVPLGQTPRQALLREAWEEAGLQPPELADLRAGRVLELHCDIPEGLQREWLFVFDLVLPPGHVPQNQDGEVAGFRCVPVAEALAAVRAGHLTTDAGLATLDCAVRHGLLDDGVAQALAALRVDPVAAARIEPTLQIH
jgi:8-oxo-dGTP pyrophosphatase MutT (NUDIX family)